MTLTIELPDDTVETVRAAAALRGQELTEYAVEAILDNAALDAAGEELDAETSAAVVAAGQQALEDIKAGRLLTLEESDANAEAALARRRAEREAQRRASAVIAKAA